MKCLPNLITLLRIFLVPTIAIILWQKQSHNLAILAFSLFIIAAASDWLDGYLARRLNITSSLGRMLDPIADKLLVAVCILSLATQRGADKLFLLPALVIIFREFMVSGLREHLAANNISVFVSNAAKWKTAVQMTAIGFFIASPIIPDITNHVDNIGLGLFWLSAILTLKTGIDYFRAGWTHL